MPSFDIPKSIEQKVSDAFRQADATGVPQEVLGDDGKRVMLIVCPKTPLGDDVDTLRAALAESRAREERKDEALRSALPVMAQCAIHVGYVTHERGGQAAIKEVSEKWPPCAHCSSAADHYEHCKQVCEQIDAALAPAPASREGETSECICAGIIASDERRHFRECPLRAKYPDPPARGRDPSGGEVLTACCAHPWGSHDTNCILRDDAPAQAPDDAARAAREWLETPDEDGRYVCDDSDDDFCAKLAALLRARDEATWNAAVEACAKELEDPKLFNVHPTMLRRIRDLKKHGGPASG